MESFFILYAACVRAVTTAPGKLPPPAVPALHMARPRVHLALGSTLSAGGGCTPRPSHQLGCGGTGGPSPTDRNCAVACSRLLGATPEQRLNQAIVLGMLGGAACLADLQPLADVAEHFGFKFATLSGVELLWDPKPGEEPANECIHIVAAASPVVLVAEASQRLGGVEVHHSRFLMFILEHHAPK